LTEVARRPLVELARLYGVMPSYREREDGPERPATEDALLGVLRALGAPVERPGDVDEAVRARRAELTGALAPPVAVAWSSDTAGAVASVTVHLAESERSRGLDCRLELEDGGASEWRAGADALDPEPDGGRAEHRSVRARLNVPDRLPHGYHRLTLRAGGREASTSIVSAPTTTWEPPGEQAGDLGLFLPLYALRTERSWGTADLSDLHALLGWSAERGARFVGTLPLTAAFLGQGRTPLAPSPYAPASRLFWNELYLDVERAPGLDAAPEARALLTSSELRAAIGRAREGRRVRYRDAMALKRDAIDALASGLAPAGAPLSGPLAAYADAHPEAVEYARFRAATERLGPWPGWPAAARLGAEPADATGDAAVRSHLYAQWAMTLQMAELTGDARAALYLDLPLGAHSDGFDVWRYRSAFATGLSGGAPPDAFQERGQDWGFPPLHPHRTRDDGHAYTRRSLRHLMGPAGMLRLDHVMWLHRLYCIPEGHAPLDGAYVRYPAEELYAILCLESNRSRCEVVGEDLGTVPDEVRDAMERHRLRRMYVLPFELDVDEARLSAPQPLSVASVGTHDLPPFAAQWTGADVDRKLGLGVLDEDATERQHLERQRWREALLAVLAGLGKAARPGEGEGTRRRGAYPGHGAAAETAVGAARAGDVAATGALLAALTALAASPARHLLVNLEDLWGELESQNMPGTVSGENWTLRSPHALETWAALPGLEKTIAQLVETRRKGKAWQT
jgi:4-alpha-glucanotransferase